MDDKKESQELKGACFVNREFKKDPFDKFTDSPKVKLKIQKLPEFEFGNQTFLRKLEVVSKPPVTLEDNSSYEG